jgi:hypothetical protein
MIIMTALRFVYAVIVEAKQLQRQTLKRYPHLRQD